MDARWVLNVVEAPAVVGVDIGGTFTDFVVLRDGQLQTFKLPSTPDDPAAALFQGLADLGIDDGATVYHGTTVATNAVLEQKGARTALIATAGFADLLELARQTRPSLYDLDQTREPALVPPERRLELDERIAADGTVLRHPSVEELNRIALAVSASGAESIAVCLLFSFLDHNHEMAVARVLERALPGIPISCSCEVLPIFREYERTSATVVNAYVRPAMHRYVESLQSRLGGRLQIMQSSGSLMSPDFASRQPVRALLSGPAAGVLGAVETAKRAGFSKIITLDMGGTSTDVALCDGGPELAYESSIGGLPVHVPTLSMHTVGAGGGSIAQVDAGGAVRVGPQSAGADPGPACYGKGDDPTVTDAHVVLGRIPANWKLAGRLPVAHERARAAISRIAGRLQLSVEDTASGVIAVANAAMRRALGVVSVERGHDPRSFVLVAFGGAGPLHACELAESLGIETVLVPRFPGTLAAFGLLTAPRARETERTVLGSPAADSPAALAHLAGEMADRAAEEMVCDGVDRRELVVSRALDIRYAGQSFELAAPWLHEAAVDDTVAEFHRAHAHRYGRAWPERPVEIVTLHVRVERIAESVPTQSVRQRPGRAEPSGLGHCWERGAWLDIPWYERGRLVGLQQLLGPAIVCQDDATTWIPSGWRAVVDHAGNLVVALNREVRVADA